MHVSLEEAYREACLALGEAIVQQRLTSKYLAERVATPPPPPADPPSSQPDT